MIFVNESILHFFIGVVIAIFPVVMSSYTGKRRRAFRFGGDQILSLGDKKKWLLWYLVAYGFEFLTSMHLGMGVRMYVEIAFSGFQAFFLTAGLFIVDRVSMIFLEPESYWRKPPTTDASAKSVSVVAPTSTVGEIKSDQSVQSTQDLEDLSLEPSQSVPVSAVEVAVPQKEQKKSWFGNRLSSLRNAPALAKNKVDIFVKGRRATKMAQDNQRSQEKKRRLDKLDDTLRNY